MSAAPSTEVAKAPAQESATEQGHKIFAGNLAYATTDEGLRALFAPIVGDILAVQVIQRGTRSAGYGFVSVPDMSAVEKAVAQLNKKELDGRELIVEAAKPAEDKEKEKTERRTKKRAAGRRGNKAPQGEVTEAEANGEAPETLPAAEGEEKKKRTKKARKPRNKKLTAAPEGDAAAAVPATTDAAASTAAATPADSTAKKPKRVIRTPRAPRAENEQPEGEPSKSVVFVANLAFNVDDAALAELFTTAGINVVSARVVRRRFGQPRRSKGYGFVDVGDEAQQKKALEAFAGKEVAGREIAVKIAVSAPAGSDNDTAAGALTEKALAKKNEADAAPDATVVAH